jgi:large subunit ribosomal protein L24
MEKKQKVKIKLRVKKDDRVKIIAGDDKGKTGKVLEIITDSNRAIVEGINIVSRHTKPNAQNQQGGIIKKEAPIHISNLAVLDKNEVATKVGRMKNEEGKTVRFSKKSENKDIIN